MIAIPPAPDPTSNKDAEEDEHSEQSSETASIATRHDPPPIVSLPEKTTKKTNGVDSLDCDRLKEEVTEEKIQEKKNTPQQNDDILQEEKRGQERKRVNKGH